MPAVTAADGPVAVTGASGYIGAHTVLNLVGHGYQVRACVRDPGNAAKTEHLLAMNAAGHRGRVELFSGDVFLPGSYDEPFRGCSAVFHVGTAVGYNQETSRQVYDGTLSGTRDVLDSVRRAGTVRRFINVSSFAAVIGVPVDGHEFTEKDWADDRNDGTKMSFDEKDWDAETRRRFEQTIEKSRDAAYSIAKTMAERLANRVAEEDGRFDAISIMPFHVLGPLLSRAHNQAGSWQWCVGRILAGKPLRGTTRDGTAWSKGEMVWNITDVRDCAEAMRLAAESTVCRNGSRYCLSAADDSAILHVQALRGKLGELFPEAEVDVSGERESYSVARSFCGLARQELGLVPHSVEDTLVATGRTSVELGVTRLAKSGSPASKL